MSFSGLPLIFQQCAHFHLAGCQTLVMAAVFLHQTLEASTLGRTNSTQDPLGSFLSDC